MADLDGQISFLYTLKDIDVKIPVPRNKEHLISPILSNVRNISLKDFRKLFAVSGLVFLLICCYQIPSPALFYHKEGVIHNNVFEYQSSLKQAKNDGMLFWGLPGSSIYDPLSLKLRTYRLIQPKEWQDFCAIHSYSSEHRGRDDLLKNIRNNYQ